MQKANRVKYTKKANSQGFMRNFCEKDLIS